MQAEKLINTVYYSQLQRKIKPKKLKPLFTQNNPKILKSLRLKVFTIGLSLAPAEMNGSTNFCTSASKQCLKDCLNLSGRGRMNTAQNARLRKSKELINDPISFFPQLIKEIRSAQDKAKRNKFTLAIRLNVLSDLRWEMIKVTPTGKTLFDLFPDVQFYDYTKHDLEKRITPENYVLTFSYTGYNKRKAQRALSLGHRIAVVFNHKKIPMPKTFLDHKTVSGDEHDLVFVHPPSTVLMLTAKGSALHSINSPFILGS